MDISSLTASSFLGDPTSDTNDPAAGAIAKADKRFQELLAASDDAKETLADITKAGVKGYWEWKMKELKKQITEKVMGDMNLTPEKIAAMGDKQRVEVENKITQTVEQQLRLAMEEEMKKRKQENLAAGASMNSVISLTQNIALANAS